MDTFRESRKDKLLKPELHDPYLKQRHTGPAQCPVCSATCHAGRWSWQPLQSNGRTPGQVTCPACRRIADDMPAGTLTLTGDFVGPHQDEILNLIRNTETKEKGQHALERIMACRVDGNTMVVTTTGVHLANRIGHALSAAYKGCTEYRYSDGDVHLAVNWLRN